VQTQQTVDGSGGSGDTGVSGGTGGTGGNGGSGTRKIVVDSSVVSSSHSSSHTKSSNRAEDTDSSDQEHINRTENWTVEVPGALYVQAGSSRAAGGDEGEGSWSDWLFRKR
jgi:hypothetical protein